MASPTGFEVAPGDDRLVVGDVGQQTWEEVSVVEAGGNYGWNVREGTRCYGAQDCPTEAPGGEPLVDPVLEYPHERDGERIGLSVIGGSVYRQSTVPQLQDRYVFGDWSRSFREPSGSLFVATPEGETWSMEKLWVAGRENGEPGRYLLAFGRGHDGELYVCPSESAGASGSSGAVHRIVPAGGTTTNQPGFGVLAVLGGYLLGRRD